MKIRSKLFCLILCIFNVFCLYQKSPQSMMYDDILRCSGSESSVALSYERLTMEIIAKEIGAEPSFTFDLSMAARTASDHNSILCDVS